MQAQVLPKTLPYFKYPSDRDADDPWQRAYRTCLRHEARAGTSVDLMRSRVLGYLILEAPSDLSRENVCDDINSCGEDTTAVCALANRYIRFLAQLFHSSWGPTSPCDFLNTPADIAETPHNKCREQAFRRDDYRCTVSGTYSNHHRTPRQGLAVGTLGIAYILPRAISICSGTNAVKTHATDVGIVVQKFGGINPEELSGDKVHRLENIMTLWDPIHSLFGDLEIWFEPTNNDPPECVIKTSYPNRTVEFRLPDSFKMTTTDPDLPRPSLDYLRLRAACARIAHLSGVTEYVVYLYSHLDL